MKKLLLIIMSISWLSSCNKDKSIIGLQEDTIKLSSQELTFDAILSEKHVSTDGEQWNMYLIMNEDTELDYSKENLKIERGTIGRAENTPLKIEGDWFVVIRELKKITVNVKANDTNKKRSLKIGVNDRNYFDRISVEQLGKE